MGAGRRGLADRRFPLLTTVVGIAQAQARHFGREQFLAGGTDFWSNGIHLNAIEASPSGTTVRVELSLEKNHTASIRVLDMGPLLTADEADLIFRPFYSQKKEGLGLGLSVSQSLVDNNDGILRYQDNPEKCFQLLLPTRELIDE